MAGLSERTITRLLGVVAASNGLSVDAIATGLRLRRAIVASTIHNLVTAGRVVRGDDGLYRAAAVAPGTPGSLLEDLIGGEGAPGAANALRAPRYPDRTLIDIMRAASSDRVRERMFRQRDVLDGCGFRKD